MGTNYYQKVEPCSHCGRADSELHIGKSSAGWCFTLHVIPEEGINRLEDWIVRWADGHIRDEYGQAITPEDMLLIVTSRGRDKRPVWQSQFGGYKSEADFYAKNDAVPGPNNLLRCALGRFCIAHGEGTWDCCVGEFS